MKTTIDLPDEIFQRLEAIATRRGTTVANLVLEGLEPFYREESTITVPDDAIHRLRAGFHLGGTPLNRDQAHAKIRWTA